MARFVILGIYLVQALILFAVAASVFGYGGLGAVVAVFTLPLVLVVTVMWIVVNRRLARQEREADALDAEK